MDIEQLRKLCHCFPGATEQVQWEDDLVFKVRGKMYAVARLEPGPVCLSFKASDEDFADLTERPGIIPAPYLARAKWIAIESPQTLPQSEAVALLRKSYDLVVAKLPATARASLTTAKRPSRKRKNSTRRKKR